MMILWLSP